MSDRLKLVNNALTEYFKPLPVGNNSVCIWWDEKGVKKYLNGKEYNGWWL